MMKVNYILLVLAIALSGCMSIKDLPPSGSSESTINLCKNYGEKDFYNGSNSKLPNMRAELIRRKAFSRSEWRLIDERTIQVGMSTEALICAWGIPDRINRSSYGNAQYVFTHHDASYGQYVYVNESTNRVTAWN